MNNIAPMKNLSAAIYQQAILDLVAFNTPTNLVETAKYLFLKETLWSDILFDEAGAFEAFSHEAQIRINKNRRELYDKLTKKNKLPKRRIVQQQNQPNGVKRGQI